MNNKHKVYLSTVLLFIVGFVNTVVFIYCGRALVAFMGGNIAEFSAGIVDFSRFHILRGMFVIISYILGSFIGTLIRTKSEFHRPIIIIVNMVMIIIALFFIVNKQDMATVYLFAFMMGNQTAILINFEGVMISQGFSTGLTAQIGEGYALLATKQIKKTSVLLHTYKFIIMVIGGVIGALLTFPLSFFETSLVLLGLYLLVLIYMIVMHLNQTKVGVRE